MSAVNRLLSNRNVQILAILAVIAWIAHYWYFRDFGLYTDDYTFFGTALDWSPAQVLFRSLNAFRELPQGRPFHFSIPFAMSAFLYPLGGLGALYIAGYVVIVANIGMMYSIIRKITGSQRAAVVGALVMIVYPAVATHLWLTHSLILFVSFLFFQLALWFYLQDRRFLAYALIVIPLFYYESPFPVFLVVPFLKPGWHWRGVIVNALYIAGWFVIAYILRRAVGEDRALDIDALDALSGSLIALFQGTWVSLTAFIQIIPTTLNALRADMIVAALGCGGLMVMALYKLERRTVALRYAFIGLAALMISYSLAFTDYSLGGLMGPDTSVHIAGLFGASLFIAVITARVPIAPLVVALAFVVGYRVSIQHVYIRGWEYQQSLWSQVLQVAPDLDDGTVILIDRETEFVTEYGYGIDWSSYLVLPLLFDFAAVDDVRPPHLLFNAQNKFGFAWIGGETQPDLLRYHIRQLNVGAGNVIVLDWDNGVLTRSSSSTVMIAGREVVTKAFTESRLQSLERRPLYYLMITPSQP